jgi:hypothetical protein
MTPDVSVAVAAAGCCCYCCWPQEERRAERAASRKQRQDELRQASIADPLASSGVRMPPVQPFMHDGEAVAAVRKTASLS